MPENNSKIDNQQVNKSQASAGQQPATTGDLPELSLALVKSGVIFKGAEEFVVTSSAINLEKPGTLSKAKVSLLEKVLHPSLLTKRSVLDISSQPGYFLFSALQNNAESVTIADKDIAYLELISKATKHLEAVGVKTKRSDWRALKEQSDVVLALDSNQWFGRNEPTMQSIDESLAKIANLTNYMAIVQEVVIAHPAKTVKPSATRTLTFENLLNKHFKRVQVIGESEGTRLFACYKGTHEIDLRCPLPEFENAGELISCRQLTEFAGLQYWSRVYDGHDVIYKQATRELVQREQVMLGKLQSAFFPRVIDVIDYEDSSVLVLEKIIGISLEDDSEQITSTSSSFTLFALECLQILNELQQKGIEHRDIQAGNILIRDGIPVLLDFGWATSEELPMFVPAGLLSVSEDAQVCDVYSMGKILTALSVHKYPELTSIFQLMTEPDPVARVTSANDLSALLKLAAAAAASLPASAADLPISSSQASLLTTLIGSLKTNRARLEASQRKYSDLEEKTKIERDHRLAVLEAEYDMVVTEINKVIAELHRVIAEKDQLLELLDERQKLIEGITQGQAWRLANKLQKSKQSFGSMFGKSP